MSLRTTVAAPFRQNGTRRLDENEFVVALSLDRDWFSPDQASRVVDVATGDGLLTREGAEVVAQFDPDDVDIPDGFVPDETILQRKSAFEKALEGITDAGIEKQAAVAGANRVQQELDVSIAAAAVVFARREGVDVDDFAPAVRRELEDS